jgi:hypothetical protein
LRGLLPVLGCVPLVLSGTGGQAFDLNEALHGNKRLCRVRTAQAMALAGWLKQDADRYMITPEGASAEALH